MKKINITYMKKFAIIALCAFLLMPLTQSCLSKDDTYDTVALVTVKVINGNSYYFLLDNGSTIYPGDVSRLETAYTPINGARALVYYLLMDQGVSGYTYNANVYQIYNISTKTVVNLDDAASDTLGNNNVTIYNMWVGGGYLNVEFYVEMSGTASHSINLVNNMLVEHSADKNELEFRHNAHGDITGQSVYGMFCFRLDEYDPESTGIPLVVTVDQSGVKATFTFDPDGK